MTRGISETILVYEYGKASATKKFLEQFNNYSSKAERQKLVGKFEERNILVIQENIENRGNNVGIIEFGKNDQRLCLELRPKLDRVSNEAYFWQFLPKMLNTLYDFKDFKKEIFMDPSETIILPKGCNIIPLLALSYVSLCEKVIKKGMLKKYVKRTEDLRNIKGKIDFTSLAKKNSWDLSNIPCTYYDLTFDNPENQIILWCAHKLLNELRYIRTDGKENSVIRKLREQYHLMISEISLIPKNEADFLRLNITGIASYYGDLINVCKAIISESLFTFNDLDKRKNNGINFIIDMDWVFEQYMTNLFQQVAKESECVYKKIMTKPQHKENLCDNNKIQIRPDLVIEVDGKIKSVIDFKWKFGDLKSNADFYQVICYGLAQLQNNGISKIEVALFAVSNKDKEQGLMPEEYDKISKIFKTEKNEVIIQKINLDSSLLNNPNPDYIENNIKKEIKKYLLCLT